MHIAFFIPVLTIGGAEKVIIALANGFAEKGYKVDLVLVNKKGPLLSSVSSKVHIVDLGASKTFLSIRKLRRYLDTAKPQVLLSALDNANIVASMAVRLAATKTCHIISLHTNLKLSHKKARTSMHRLYPSIMRRLFPAATGYIAVSKCVAKESGEFLHIPSKIIDVIYNPVIQDEIKSKAEEPISHPWLEDDRYFTMVAVGRIFEAKDYPTLLYAFSKVNASIPETRLIILGDGKLEIKEEMTRIIHQEKLEHAVELHGFAHNPYAFIEKSSLLVLSSSWEGFGNVLVEALHLGTPVISTDCKCGPREILKNGELGSLVSVGDRDGLAKAILKHITQKPKIDQKAIDFHLQQMEVGYVIDRYEEIFLRLVEDRKG